MPRFIQPNLHVMLIHFPVALLMMGLFIELFSFLWRTSTARVAGRWMILLGTLALLPTATSGIYAYVDVVTKGTISMWHGSDNWYTTAAAAGMSAAQWDVLKDHLLFNGIATGIALFAVVMWVGSSDQWRRWLYGPALLLLVIATGCMVIGAHHGATAVYVQQLAVADRAAVINASQVPLAQLTPEQKIGKFASPTQLHMIFAGVTFALVAGALALSLRAAARGNEIAREHRGAIDPDKAVAPEISATTPSARFWLLACLLAILTIASGLYIGGFLLGDRVFDWPGIKTQLLHAGKLYHNRLALHIICGGSILVLSLLLAGLGRWLPRRQFMLGSVAMLLVLAVAAQILVGVILLMDGDEGLAFRFKTDEQRSAIEYEATHLTSASAHDHGAGGN